MKSYKRILIVSIIMALLLSGCGSDVTVTSGPAGNADSELISDTFGAELSTDSVVSDEKTDSAEFEQSMPDDNEISASDGETTSTTETLSPSNEASAPALDVYPSTDEILSCIDAGESKLYWVATAPSYSGVMDTLPVETPYEDDFAAELSHMLILLDLVSLVARGDSIILKLLAALHTAHQEFGDRYQPIICLHPGRPR